MKRSNSSNTTNTNNIINSESGQPTTRAKPNKFAGSKWRRPEPKPLNPNTDELSKHTHTNTQTHTSINFTFVCFFLSFFLLFVVIQQLEIDYQAVTSEKATACTDVPFPLIRMYGVTEEGNSVLVNVYGFTPYIYVQAPEGFRVEDCDSLRKNLEGLMRRSNLTGAARHNADSKKPYILGVEVVMSQSLMGYHGEELVPFIKISCALPMQVPTLRDILEGGLAWGGRPMMTYESNLLFPLRFMVDTKIVGCAWVRLPPGKYVHTSAGHRQSLCQVEVDVRYSDVENLGYEGEWSKVAPLRILSFDIECANRKGLFPDAKVDPVIQIANLVTVLGDQRPIARNLFSLGQCSNIADADVYAYELGHEAEMLADYRDFIVAADPDIIIGYNILNFDIPYLVERARALRIPGFALWGRLRGSPMVLRDSHFSSKNLGSRDSKEVLIDGRVPFDIMQVIQRDHKLRSYSLNSVSATFLDEQKEEVVHSDISVLWAGSDDDRRRLGIYCLKDAYLPQRLCDKLMIIVNNVEMARVTGVPIGYLLPHGQEIKVLTQIYRKAAERNLRIPHYKKVAASASGDDKDEKYQGATVVDPVRGFHNVPVATLDFASLYPSIMISHNICYSTLLPQNPTVRDRLCPPEDAETSPNGNSFVRASRKLGVLPAILRDLLDARKKAKGLLAKEQDPAKKAVYNSRQLALKISANSVYGVTGARTGKLPCTEIAASVTAFGREMIKATKDFVERTYSIANGFEHNSVVVYGDTDSVMVRFEIMDMERVIALGKEAAARISELFPDPVKLEFEKVYYPYLLISKKRYAGLLWTNPDKPTKIDTKGIETVRRDNCQLVKYAMDTCLNKILIKRDIPGAERFVKSIISSLLQNKLDLSLLVISKGLSKEGKDYGAKQAHVELAEKMKARDPCK